MQLEFFPFPLLVGIGILIVVLAILRKRERSLSYLFFFSLFWVYLLALVGAVLFPIPIDGNTGGMTPVESAAYILSHVNLVLFYYGEYPFLAPSYIFLREIVANILLTAPFGFGISFIARIKARDVPVLAIAVGVGTELAQLLMSLALGINYRGVDINDSLMNAIGVLLGYGFFRIFCWLYVWMTERGKIEPKGLLEYVYTVAKRV